MSTTLTVLSGSGQVTFNTTDALFLASAIATQINAAAASSFTQVTYTSASGTTAPAPVSGTGDLLFNTSPGVPVAVPTTDSVIVDGTTGPLSISGGAPGATVLAGSGGLTYTNITPGGTATAPAEIAAGDGVNYISTSTAGGGTYYIATGAGNDTVGIYTGTATVDAGEGRNLIVVGGGATAASAVIYSNGFDSIVGNINPAGTAGAGGTVTVNVQAGQDTINPGSSNFVINDASSNPLVLLAGIGSDTVNVTGTGPVTLTSGVNGSTLTLTGSGSITASASLGYVTVNAAGTTGSISVSAGLGNDSLIAGSGADTLVGSIGTFSAMSGPTGSATTFQFTLGSTTGSDTISGFKSTDFLQLLGYSGLTPSSVASTAPGGSSTTVAGSTVVTVVGGTTITLVGVASLSSTQVKTS